MNFNDIPFCPIFYPTKKEFSNFSQYLQKCEASARSGVIKVVPPKGWCARKEGYDSLEFTVNKPIEQTVHGTGGVYELIYFQRESRSLSKYKKNVQEYDKLSDNKSPEEVEKLFWKTMRFNPPLYGADIPGSLFNKGTPWNLSELDTILNKGLDQKILGVNTPYLYFGAWKTMFAWHKEDMDLYSINYLHWGKPKFWYTIMLEDSHFLGTYMLSYLLEDFAKDKFKDNRKECPEFLRHKTTMISPYLLMEKGCRIHKVLQNPGEFVITFAGAYHSGFNYGFNCAEAVNFASNRWIDIGKKAKSCLCSSDTVRINMSAFIGNIHQSHNIEDEKKEEEESLIVTHNKSKKTGEKQKEELKKSVDDKRKEKVARKAKKALNKEEAKDYIIDTWTECEDCHKWRRVTKSKYKTTFTIGQGQLNSQNLFKCSFLDNHSCETPEEDWKNDYQTLSMLDANSSKKPKRKAKAKGLVSTTMRHKLVFL